jgi:hypothetical protein
MNNQPISAYGYQPNYDLLRKANLISFFVVVAFNTVWMSSSAGCLIRNSLLTPLSDLSKYLYFYRRDPLLLQLVFAWYYGENM